MKMKFFEFCIEITNQHFKQNLHIKRQGRLKTKLKFSDDLVAYSQEIVGKTIVFFYNFRY
ncbi:hypothetical protein HMPREF1051_0265 [Neisseria sicca VK64]|uniref:Uncharacterized protein n=1 Tax=Neisseria sicca VK64 TaxID=1095748 RepID=I2NRP8_NEISI|nr:hypothetical protein HMPREF1051_0265 [Neisseria sicca VK64]